MDRFLVEELGEVVLAPDGRAVAFTRQRPAISQVTNGLLLRETRRDVWLQAGAGLPVRNLTQGQADSSGWWAPHWSPDGKHLAMLSSRGGTVQVWVWEKETGRLRQLTRSGVDHGDMQGSGGCRWVDPQRLLCQMMPPGEAATPMGRGAYHVGIGVERAESAWAKAKRGEATASALSSTEFPLLPRRLAIVNVTRGVEQHIAPTTAEYEEASWWLSPGAGVVAVRQPGPATEPGTIRQMKGYPGTVALYKLDGRPVPLARPLPANVITSTVRWSPDGRELAFFALEEHAIHPEIIWGDFAYTVEAPPAQSQEYPGRLWRVQVERGTVEPWPTGEVDLGQEATPPQFEWLISGELLFHTPPLHQGSRPVRPAGAQWLVLGRDGRTRSLVKDVASLPGALEAIEGGAAFVGVQEGDVWQIDPVKGIRTNLTAGFAPAVLSVATTAQPSGPLLLSAGDDDYVFSPRSGRPVLLSRPARTATLVSFALGSHQAVYQGEDHKGSHLWRVGTDSKTEPLLTVNAWYRQIAGPEQRLIEYTGLDQKRYTGVLTLPYGYVRGQRVPLVVDSDTDCTSESEPSLFVLRPPTAAPRLGDDYLWFASAGYAYLWASMPVRGVRDEGRSNLSSFQDGILPAVDQVVALGIADPDRVFLYGASSMGFGVYGLVTQTARFTAAVSWIGPVGASAERWPNLAYQRYGEAAHDLIGTFRYVRSTGQVIGPVWRVGEFLRRNSPLAYVDRVQTPLLIADGDFDGSFLIENETFFNALVQLRKPAQFVRYWGEGHGWETPANILDWYQRVFAWYDRWGNIVRDAKGKIVYQDGRMRSRGDRPPQPPAAYARFELFQSDKAGHAGSDAENLWRY